MIDNTFESIFLIGFVTGCVIRAFYTKRCRRDRIPASRADWLEWPLIFLVFIGMQVIPIIYLFTSWLDFADYHLPAGGGWFGAAVFAGALWLLWRSHADLGRNWSATLRIKEGQTLVTQGSYRYIRHPMYAAHWLWAMAQALLLHNWIAGFAFLLTFLPLYLMRVPREERMMLEHFGEEYRSYMSRTGRLFPRLWG